MCLRTIDKLKRVKKIKDAIGRDGIKVYKVVHIGHDAYYPLHQNTGCPFKEGRDEAVTINKILSYSSDKFYQAGFHFWVKVADAKKHLKDLNTSRARACLNWNMNQGPFQIIECIVKKSWITSTGRDITTKGKHAAIVAKKAIFPKFEEVG